MNAVSQPSRPGDLKSLPSSPVDALSQPSRPVDTVSQPSRPEDAVSQPSRPVDAVSKPNRSGDPESKSSRPEDAVSQPSHPGDVVSQPSRPEDAVSQTSRPENAVSQSTTVSQVSGSNPCSPFPCPATTVCLSIDRQHYKCLCPVGTVPSPPTTDRSTTLHCEEAKRLHPPPSEEKKFYRGTLKGGLKVVNSESQDQLEYEAVQGAVQETIGDDETGMAELIKEHFESPKHFGIHVSKLDPLEREQQQQQQHQHRVFTSIIANMS